MLNTVLELLCTIALTVMLCGTLGPRALFGARGYFWGAEPSGDMEKDGLCIFWTPEPYLLPKTGGIFLRFLSNWGIL